MKFNSIFFFILLFLAFTISCKKSESTAKFSVNQTLWNGKNILNYTFTLRLVCLCPPGRLGPNIVKVVNGKIAAVNGKSYDESVTGKLYPIKEYFDFIKSSLDKKPFRSDISYNPKYGYPEIVYFDFNEAVADDEIRYAIISLVVN